MFSFGSIKTGQNNCLHCKMSEKSLPLPKATVKRIMKLNDDVNAVSEVYKVTVITLVVNLINFSF